MEMVDYTISCGRFYAILCECQMLNGMINALVFVLHLAAKLLTYLISPMALHNKLSSLYNMTPFLLYDLWAAIAQSV